MRNFEHGDGSELPADKPEKTSGRTGLVQLSVSLAVVAVLGGVLYKYSGDRSATEKSFEARQSLRSLLPKGVSYDDIRSLECIVGSAAVRCEADEDTLFGKDKFEAENCNKEDLDKLADSQGKDKEITGLASGASDILRKYGIRPVFECHGFGSRHAGSFKVSMREAGTKKEERSKRAREKLSFLLASVPISDDVRRQLECIVGRAAVQCGADLDSVFDEDKFEAEKCNKEDLDKLANSQGKDKEMTGLASGAKNILRGHGIEPSLVCSDAKGRSPSFSVKVKKTGTRNK